MKIIKRDGRIVDYDRQKIAVAIEKANRDVIGKEKATKEEIKEIIDFIEGLGKKRILVEDVQDIIEDKLMDMGKHKLAKEYIVYRYNRALVRKSNTTDESILGLIRNENKEQLEDDLNKNTMIASTQRDYIAGEVSRDLTNRLLLPEKIVKAHQDGVLHFHDAEYFVQPICNYSLINIGDMLDNGTVINGKLIESPKSFQVACIVMTQIIASVASNQYGGQYVNLKTLGKYLRKSYNKYKMQLEEKYKGKLSGSTIEELVDARVKQELESGVQTIQYQINTLMTTKGKPPYVTLILQLEENDPYIKENAIIIEKILEQRIQGIKNEVGEYVTPELPKLVYVLDENNCLKGGKYDYLTRLAVKCSAKGKTPSYISAKKMRENYEKDAISTVRFNQGVVSINLPQIAIIAEGDEEKFWKILEERLELCKEALMCRHYALMGTQSDISPIHWQYGAIARLQKGEKIDTLLHGEYSTMSLGYIGIYEMTKLMKGVSHIEKDGHEFALKVMKYLRETVDKWRKETNIRFILCGITKKGLGHKFAKIDKEKFGTIEDVTDKGYYTKSYHVNEKEKMGIFENLKFESEFQKVSLGEEISYVEIPNMQHNLIELENAVKFIYENVQYAEFN